MFVESYEQRLCDWHSFRQSLETSDDAIQDVIDFYQTAPRVLINCDPWDPSTWPSPWELIEQNEYCDYCILLGICYTLQLTDKFTNSKFVIHIGIDQQNSTSYFLLSVDDRIVGYQSNTHCDVKDLPSSIGFETVYHMPHLK